MGNVCSSDTSFSALVFAGQLQASRGLTLLLFKLTAGFKCLLGENERLSSNELKYNDSFELQLVFADVT